MAAGDHTVTGTMTANKVVVADTVVVANLNADQVDGADRDIDGTLAGNSDASVPTEKAVKTYVDAHKSTETAGVHGSTAAATANKLVHRDAAGRAKVVAPAASTDIALKSTVTDDIATHAALAVAGTHGSTVAATANKLIHRDASGRAQIAAPSAAADIARKDTVDALAGVGRTTETVKDNADTIATKADDDAVVHDTGNEAVAGVKTFSSVPVFSAGAKIGDAGVALNSKVIAFTFSGTNSATAAHGLTGSKIRAITGCPVFSAGLYIGVLGYHSDTAYIFMQLSAAATGTAYAVIWYVP